MIDRRTIARSTLWLPLAVLAFIPIGALVHPSAVGAQSGAAAQADETSIGGTVVNAATSKPEGASG